MKAYIAGPLWKKEDRAKLEKINKICKDLKIDTFLPHRDVGLYKEGDSKEFFIKNKKGLDECNLIVAYLDWKYIGSGTAWELGYGYAKNIPIIGLVEDIKTIKEYDRLCVMTFNSIDLVENLENLKKKLIEIPK